MSMMRLNQNKLENTQEDASAAFGRQLKTALKVAVEDTPVTFEKLSELSIDEDIRRIEKYH